MGELLGEMDLDKGAATPSQNEIASPQKLSDLGIDHNQSHRYQRIAILPVSTKAFRSLRLWKLDWQAGFGRFGI